MPWKPKFLKKPWEREECSFVLQEYGAEGGRGWCDITDPTGNVPTKAEAMEHFQPGKHYRVMARAISGEGAGRLVGAVWTHYEMLPGGLKAAGKPKPEKAVAKKDVVTAMGEYAEEVERVLTPMVKISEVFERIRESFGGVPSSPSEGAGEGEEGTYSVPPLEYDGKAPWFLHPQVAHTIAGEMKGVIDHLGKTMDKVLHGAAEEAAKPEEEEPLLPQMPTEEEKPLEEEEAEEAEEGEELLPPGPAEMPSPEAPSEPSKPQEEKELITVPSLLEGEEIEKTPAEEERVEQPAKRKRGKKNE